MTDIVTRLRYLSYEDPWVPRCQTAAEGAAEIERLRSEIECLRSEVAAREAAAAEAMREACAKAALRTMLPDDCGHEEAHGRFQQAIACCEAVRALPIPAADALARELDRARAEEREACALIADAATEPDGPMPEAMNKHAKETLARAAVLATKREIAAAIRARGKEVGGE